MKINLSINVEKKHVYVLIAGLVLLSSLILVVGTGYTSGAFHETLFADIIQGKSSATVQVQDDLVVSGNLGVGITSPTQKLDVDGNVKAAGLCLGSDCKTNWNQVTTGLVTVRCGTKIGQPCAKGIDASGALVQSLERIDCPAGMRVLVVQSLGSFDAIDAWGRHSVVEREIVVSPGLSKTYVQWGQCNNLACLSTALAYAICVKDS